MRMAEAGESVPDLDEQPELEPHLQFEWTAFFLLSTDRPAGFGLGRIPWSSIDRYATRAGIDDADEFERFVRLITAMDATYIDDWAERHPAPSP